MNHTTHIYISRRSSYNLYYFYPCYKNTTLKILRKALVLWTCGCIKGAKWLPTQFHLLITAFYSICHSCAVTFPIENLDGLIACPSILKKMKVREEEGGGEGEELRYLLRMCSQVNTRSKPRKHCYAVWEFTWNNLVFTLASCCNIYKTVVFGKYFELLENLVKDAIFQTYDRMRNEYKFTIFYPYFGAQRNGVE